MVGQVVGQVDPVSWHQNNEKNRTVLEYKPVRGCRCWSDAWVLLTVLYWLRSVVGNSNWEVFENFWAFMSILYISVYEHSWALLSISEHFWTFSAIMSIVEKKYMQKNVRERDFLSRLNFQVSKYWHPSSKLIITRSFDSVFRKFGGRKRWLCHFRCVVVWHFTCRWKMV